MPKEFVASRKKIVEKPELFQVIDTQYERNKGKNGKLDTLRGTHKVVNKDAPMGIGYVMEYICIEHPEDNFGRKNAIRWWRQCSRHACPETIQEALEIIGNIGVAKFHHVTAKRDGRFWRVLKHECGEAPEPVPMDWGEDPDCPF